jgi:phosphate butyryltransferase
MTADIPNGKGACKMIKDFKELLKAARNKKNIVAGVPCPEDENTILSIIQAKKKNLADFVLCGSAEKISRLLEKHGGQAADYEIIDCPDADAAAGRTVELAREKKVQLILKGFLPTAALMKPVLDKEKGLRSGNLLSDILVVENPAANTHELLGMSDGGLNILPNLDQKKQIMENAVTVFQRLGYPEPKVGIMAAIETVKESMPATVDARALTEMNRRGEIKGCLVDGPLALDIAVSPEAAKHKGIAGDVAGHVQIMIVPNIEAGNLLGKAFSYYLRIPVAHVVMGARIPIMIPSRNENEVDKFYSLALGVLSAER